MRDGAVKSIADRVQAAGEAANRGEAVRTIEALLEAWRACRSPKLAEALERVTAAAQPEAEPDWDDAVEANDLALLPRLVSRLASFAPREATARVARLNVAADPRVAAAIVSLLEETFASNTSFFAPPPLLTRVAKGFWVKIFALLAAAGDPRVATLRLGRTRAETRLTEWIREKAALVAKRAPAPGRLPSGIAGELAKVKLARVVQPSVAARARGPSSRELFAAVYAAPDDDAPRAVLADWLQERGDPRGEFIALQLARAGDTKREMTLLRKHYKAWLGELSVEFGGTPAVGPIAPWEGWEKRHRWHRGFLAGATVRSSGPKLRRLSSAPVWATVEELTLWGVAGPVEKAPERDALALLESLRALRTVHQAEPQLVALIDRVPSLAKRIEEISIYLYDEDADQILDTLLAWPGLRRLDVSCQLEDVAPLERLVRAFGMSSLEGLRLHGMYELAVRRDGRGVVVDKRGRGAAERRLLAALGVPK